MKCIKTILGKIHEGISKLPNAPADVLLSREYLMGGVLCTDKADSLADKADSFA